MHACNYIIIFVWFCVYTLHFFGTPYIFLYPHPWSYCQKKNKTQTHRLTTHVHVSSQAIAMGEFDYQTQNLKMKDVPTAKDAAEALQDPYTNFVHVGSSTWKTSGMKLTRWKMDVRWCKGGSGQKCTLYFILYIYASIRQNTVVYCIVCLYILYWQPELE